MKSVSHAPYPDPKLELALSQGKTIVTANQRLANYLRQQHDQHRLQQHAAWPSADILPLDNWLERCWQALQEEERITPTCLLNDYQSLTLWENIIRASGDSTALLQLHATAQQAQQAWHLSHYWQIDIQHPAFKRQPDCHTWQQWAIMFAQHCAQQHLIDKGALVTLLTHVASTQNFAAINDLVLLGLDEIPTQLHTLFTLLRTQGYSIECLPPPQQASTRYHIALADTEDELWHMAAWTKHCLDQDPTLTLACIVPNLTELRARVATIFQQTHSPLALLPQQPVHPPVFNISAGQHLLDFPLVQCAHLILRLGTGTLPLNAWGLLLRSPFWAAATAEYDARANLDCVLREYGETTLTLGTLLRLCRSKKRHGFNIDCPALHAHLQQLHALSPPTHATPSDWSRYFALQLTRAGWPGDATLDSHEYQLLQRTQQLFEELAHLDLVQDTLSHAQALTHWQQLANHCVFQFKSAEPRIHILGTLEAVGLCFDKVWLMGLHDGAWPAPAAPHPFLPLTLQRANNVPRACAQRELRFAQQLLQHIAYSGTELIFSHPRSDKDHALHVSPLLQHLLPLHTPTLVTPTPYALMQQLYATQTLEHIVDIQAPPLQAHEKITGGTRVLKLQAACPFRAFAELRLHAQGLQEPSMGLDALARGKLVHRSLELIWHVLGDQASLRQYPPAQLTQLVQTYIQQSLDEINASYLYPRSPMLLHLEKQRLQQLIMQWLHLEKERVPFCVVATEQRCAIQLGELSLHVVLDRMDKVEGEHVIIDYKTNDNSIYAWFDERPDEPQLPLYCISSTTPIAGLLFAQLRSEKLEFKGIVTDPSWIPNSVAASTFSNATPAWHALQQDWQRVLHHLATDFSQGNARVDPKRQQHTCQYCTLSTLCRIRELTLGNDYATA